jgi:hypothetical protein
MRGCYSVNCWQRKFRMLWRRKTGPKRPGRACPGHPRVSAQRTTARGRRGHKNVVSEVLATIRCCRASSLRRRGVDGRVKPGQARPGRQRRRKQPTNSYRHRAKFAESSSLSWRWLLLSPSRRRLGLVSPPIENDAQFDRPIFFIPLSWNTLDLPPTNPGQL